MRTTLDGTPATRIEAKSDGTVVPIDRAAGKKADVFEREVPVAERAARRQVAPAPNHEKVVIIGSGPAGYTAAIYAARAALNPLLFKGAQWGGQLTTTSQVENYPGFDEGVDGTLLTDKMEKQAQRFGARTVAQTISKVDFSTSPFQIWDGDQRYTADAVIISTGASARWLNIPSEKEYHGKGVSACATCDGFFFRDKVVAVVGGGDSALEEANFLTRFAKKVFVIHRRDSLRASKVLQERARNNPKIGFIYNAQVAEVVGDDKKVTGLRLTDTKDGSSRELPVDGMFLGIGHHPNTQLFEGQLALDANGYIKVKSPTAETSQDGVFAAGDVADPHYRQAVTAAGSGATAALDAERWIEARESEERSAKSHAA